METPQLIGYSDRIRMTLEKRKDALEQRVSALVSDTNRTIVPKRDWGATFGFSREDPEFEEMAKLGEEYRFSLRLEDRAQSRH